MATHQTKPAFKTIVRGRVKCHEHIESKKPGNKGFYKTTVIVPGKDNYDYPKTYAVNASAPLAPDNQDIAVICDIRPFNRNGFNNLQLWLAEESDNGTEN